MWLVGFAKTKIKTLTNIRIMYLIYINEVHKRVIEKL